MQLGLSQSLGVNLAMTVNVMLNPKMMQMLRILNLPYNELLEQINAEAEINPLLEVERRDCMMDYLKSQSNTPFREKNGVKTDAVEMEKYIKKSTDIYEHLSSQAALLDTSEEQKEVLALLIRSLDPRGYLNDYGTIKEDIKKELSVPDKEVDKALELLQSLEPEGVGARDLKECLLIQIREYDFDSEELRQVLEKTVDAHIEDLAEGNMEKIAGSLGIGMEGAVQIADFIKNNLNPHPGSVFAEKSTIAIPSFSLKKEKDGFKIINLETKYGPEVTINQQYIKMLDDPKTDEKTLAYIKEKLEKAKELLEQLAKRRDTIEKILRFIAENQKEYLDKKTNFPKPMTQKEISAKFGMHPSTISRAIAEKYIETPLGVIKIRSLCPRQFMGMTSAMVADAVAGIIKNEDASKPMTDEEIQKELSEKGITLKRRTISDYRKKLELGTSSKRKKK